MSEKSSSDRIAIWLAFFAFLLSSASFYFQFFHVKDSVNIAKLDFRANPGGFEVVLAASNVGSTDVLVAYIGLQLHGSNYEFKPSIKPPFSLKPGEVKLIEFSSSLDVTEAYLLSTKQVEEHELQLDTRLIGGTGWDRLDHTVIGKVLEQQGHLVGHDLLKFPVNL